MEKERERLTKKVDKLRSGIEGSRKKLANENFVSRAKPEVVDRERERLADLESQRRAVREQLERLGDGAA